MPIVIDEDGGSEEVESDDEYLDAPEHMDDDDIFVAQPSRFDLLVGGFWLVGSGWFWLDLVGWLVY